MLKNIPEVISPDLMQALMQMGHGDDIVIGDINFPSYTMSNRCVYAKGIRATELIEAILQFMPLDVFVDNPVSVMKPGAMFKGTPQIWKDYETIIRANDFCGAFKGFEQVDRFDFYERAKNSFVTVQTSEDALYACIIMKKGVIRLLVAEIPTDRIESIYCYQGLLGRLFRYGTLSISGVGGMMPVFKMVHRPYALRRKIVDIIEKNKAITVVHGEMPKAKPVVKPEPVEQEEPIHRYGTFVRVLSDNK